MVTKSRLEKAINGLNKIVQRHEEQNKFIFSNDKLIIDKCSSQFIPILLISLILLLPIGLGLYYSLADNANSIIFWALLLEIILINDFYKLIHGSTTLTVNFNDKYIQAENSLPSIKKIFPTKKISFSEISKVSLMEKAISGKERWLQLSVYHKNNKILILTDFSQDYPESLIAGKVKFLIDVIIWTEKQIPLPLTQQD